jgi:hypothetical protein
MELYNSMMAVVPQRIAPMLDILLYDNPSGEALVLRNVRAEIDSDWPWCIRKDSVFSDS